MSTRTLIWASIFFYGMALTGGTNLALRGGHYDQPWLILVGTYLVSIASILAGIVWSDFYRGRKDNK